MGMLDLTQKEEEVLHMFWEHGNMFVHDVRELYPVPRPHFNTVSTFVRSLENKGYLWHEVIGFSYKYYPKVTEEEYISDKLNTLIAKYFRNSATRVVATLLDNGSISFDDLRMLAERAKKKQ